MGWTTAATAATAWRPPEPEGDEFKFSSFNDDILDVNQRTLSSINVYSRLFVDDDESLTGTCQTRIA